MDNSINIELFDYGVYGIDYTDNKYFINGLTNSMINEIVKNELLKRDDLDIKKYYNSKDYEMMKHYIFLYC